MNNPACEFCAFWKGSETDNWSGECHRRAPVFDRDFKRGVWPTTARTDLCGEFVESTERPAVLTRGKLAGLTEKEFGHA